MLTEKDKVHIQASMRGVADREYQLLVVLEQFPGQEGEVCELLGIPVPEYVPPAPMPSERQQKRSKGLAMVAQGVPEAEVAEQLHVTTGTVYRWEKQFRPDLYTPPPKYTPEQKAEVMNLLGSGFSASHVSKLTGVPAKTVRNWGARLLGRCDMDCEHCELPQSRCHGGSKKTPYTDKGQRPIMHGEENHEHEMPALHRAGRKHR